MPTYFPEVEPLLSILQPDEKRVIKDVKARGRGMRVCNVKLQGRFGKEK